MLLCVLQSQQVLWEMKAANQMISQYLCSNVENLYAGIAHV